MLSTGTAAALTVRITLAVLPPSAVVTVIVVVPADLAVTVPSAAISATDGSVDDHVTF